jgi:hypothetical protein
MASIREKRMIDLECKVCGHKFKRSHRDKRNESFYCSRDCYYKETRSRSRLPKGNPIIEEYTVKIPLGNDHYAIVDRSDWDGIPELRDYSWHRTIGFGPPGKKLYYAACTVSSGKNKKNVLMHRIIEGLHKGEYIDHVDFDGTNNRQSNMRRCSFLENTRSRRKKTGCVSRYKGVSFMSQKNGKYTYWAARITVDKKTIRLGLFKTEEEAALAYNEAAKKHFGDFANLNKVE